MCEPEVALEYFWTPSHILQVTKWSHYLIYIDETPEHLLKIKIDFLPLILLPSFLFHSVTLDGRDIVVLTSFSFRIKRPCSHWNSWFYPLKTGFPLQKICPAIKCTQKQRFDMYFHSQPGIFPITSHFDVIFIIIKCDERQNVVVKSNILTMFHNLKPRTIFISTRDRSIPLFILQLIEKLSIIDVARAKKHYIMSWWVVSKSV